MSARISSKVGMNGLFRGKRISKINVLEAIIPRNQKGNLFILMIILECVSFALFYIKINWKCVL